jgi:hypothetical protein
MTQRDESPKLGAHLVKRLDQDRGTHARVLDTKIKAKQVLAWPGLKAKTVVAWSNSFATLVNATGKI